MGRTKKQTKAQIAAKAKAAAKRMTYGKINNLVALGGPMGYRAMKFQETGNMREFTVGIPKDQAGINPDDGSFELMRLSRGYGGPIYNKIEKALFKGAGVKLPPLKPKNIKDLIRLGVYNAAAIANASGGTMPKDKFRKWYHSHFGVNLEAEGSDALDYSKPLLEKAVPYILVNKIMQWVT